ncbi:MAG: hypothetical protein KatS3mg009_1481 [Acidimicrobiia bacterium]|nr:MAG: hypothetical protein KatS3mg009_1481 [Acidimicrobiia bacterium]
MKTSLAPGLARRDRLPAKRCGLCSTLGSSASHVVGYGCTTCIGNSGPLPGDLRPAIDEGSLSVVSVLRGNRNFEGRIHPRRAANYLASPPLVVAYALAGTMDTSTS